MLSHHARLDPFGYTSFPNFIRNKDPSPIARAVRAAYAKGQAEGFVPVLSSEGWISAPKIFADILSDLSYPRVDVVVFLRPPLEWLNAAYWQWGTWLAGDVEHWLHHGGLAFDFGAALKKWDQIPHVRMHVRAVQGDVLGQFSAATGLRVPSAGKQNAASPRSLIGVLLRNRHFRVDGHDSQTEFVFKRWCPMVRGPKLWAFDARQMEALRLQHQEELSLLRRYLDPSQDLGLLTGAPQQVQAKTTEADFRAASELGALYAALRTGLEQACSAAGRSKPKLADLPRVRAETIAPEEIAAWDAPICAALEALLDADKAARAKRPGRIIAHTKAQARRLWHRMRKRRI
jgi:hypothetical protein